MLKLKYCRKQVQTSWPLLQVSENMTRASTSVALQISHTSSAGVSLEAVWLSGLCFQVNSHAWWRLKNLKALLSPHPIQTSNHPQNLCPQSQKYRTKGAVLIHNNLLYWWYYTAILLLPTRRFWSPNIWILLHGVLCGRVSRVLKRNHSSHICKENTGYKENLVTDRDPTGTSDSIKLCQRCQASTFTRRLSTRQKSSKIQGSRSIAFPSFPWRFPTKKALTFKTFRESRIITKIEKLCS